MIELNKVYTDGDVFRTPIAVTVTYRFTSNQKELGKVDGFDDLHQKGE